MAVGISKLTTMAAAAIAAGTSIGASHAQTTSNYGFVLSSLHPAFYRGDEKTDCPEGRYPSWKETYLATLSPAERERLLKPENSVELEKGIRIDHVYGKNGHDVCFNAAEFDTPDYPVQKPVGSKVAPGLNLDGTHDGHRVPLRTCAHKKFLGLDGTRGIDNQYFRAIACNTFWRGAVSGGVGDALGESPLIDGAAVMVVKNVHSWVDDAHVEVVIAASDDKPPKDLTQKIVDGGSMTMTDTSRYRIATRGRIENGVLTTEPVDLVLPDNWVGTTKGELIFKHMRLRVKLQPNGDLSGVAGGYRPIDNVIGSLEIGGPGVAAVAGVDCPSVRKTLRILADGDPDPKTGACTTDSMALDFEAKPAFVFDRGVLVGRAGGGAMKAADR